MSSERRFFSGDSLAQALNQAAQHFEMLPGEIDYKLVDKRHGFLKVRRKVVIEVDAANPGGGGSPESPATSREAAPVDDAVASPPPVEEDLAPEPEPEPYHGTDPDPPEPSAPRPMLEADAFDEDLGEEPAVEPATVGVVELPESPAPTTSRLPGARGEEAEAAADALVRILELAALDLDRKSVV